MVEELVDVDDVLELVVVDECCWTMWVDVLLVDDALVLVLLAVLVSLVVVLLVTACVSSAVRDMACVLTKDDCCLLSPVQVPEVSSLRLPCIPKLKSPKDGKSLLPQELGRSRRSFNIQADARHAHGGLAVDPCEDVLGVDVDAGVQDRVDQTCMRGAVHPGFRCQCCLIG